MKKFLLIVHFVDACVGDTDKWIGCFATREEAENAIIKEPYESKLQWESESQTRYRYKTNDTDYVDWYEIVDLEEWMNK
jgi:hypothetical protein